MNRSENIGDLITALAKAQSEFGAAVKTTENKAFGSKYADLAANIDAVRPALNKHGIAFMQFPVVDLETQVVSVETALHCGEQFISQTFEAPAAGRQGFNVQSIGAATTYLRRYGLQALCGLASEDDDGNSVAVENKPVAKVAKYEKSPEPEKPILPTDPATDDDRKKWEEEFAKAVGVYEFNTQIQPLMVQRGREFVVAVNQEAKRRGYGLIRETGKYSEKVAK